MAFIFFIHQLSLISVVVIGVIFVRVVCFAYQGVYEAGVEELFTGCWWELDGKESSLADFPCGRGS